MSTSFLFSMPSNVLPLHLKQTFPLIIWIFTKREGDGIKSRLPFKVFSTLACKILDCKDSKTRTIQKWIEFQRILNLGCDGNENNFHNILACKVICQEPNKTTDDDLLFQIIIGAKNQTEEVKKCGLIFNLLCPNVVRHIL